jgi:hypothetical protein
VWFDAGAPNRKLFSEEGRAGCSAVWQFARRGREPDADPSIGAVLRFFWTFEVKLLFENFVLVLSLPI